MFPALEQEISKCKDDNKVGEWILHVDGSNNVRGVWVGILLTSPSADIASKYVRRNFKATNNKSEYEAMIAELTLVKLMGAKNI